MKIEHKTSLTPQEKIKAAYYHEIKGLHQHLIADIFNVNSGRVAEAIISVRKAVGISATKQTSTDA